MSNYQPPAVVPKSAKTMSIIGIVSGVVALVILPILFGPIAAILGFVAYSKGDKPRGLYVGIWGIVATVLGFVIGALILTAASS